MPNDRDRTARGQFAKGNKASMSSGLAHGLAHSRLPKGMSKVSRDLSKWRRALEDAVRVRHGSPDVIRCGLVAGAVSHERMRRLAERWWMTRIEAGTLTTDELAKLHAVISASTEARDRLVSRLLGEGNDFTPTPAGGTSDDQPFHFTPTALADLQQGFAYLDKPRNDLDAK